MNIVEGRRTAQERVTGGRWRRIVLGDVLAEHVVELRGRALANAEKPVAMRGDHKSELIVHIMIES